MVAESALISTWNYPMYHPTTRVLAVLEMLQAHGRMTGAEMAGRLEVNIRTLRRYVTMLQDLGIPIVAERGRNGAYELTAGFKLPPMMFTNDEAHALALGLVAARGLGISDAASAVESAQAKLERVLPLELKGRVRALSETITLDVESAATRTSNEVIARLSRAAQSEQRVRMRYGAQGGAETVREFDAYGLARHAKQWYVVGMCHLRNDVRSFRVDRIRAVELLDARFVRPEDFDVRGHLVRGIATMPREFPFEVLLKTDMATARLKVFASLGELEECEGGVRLRGSVQELDWLACELSRFTFPFIVREPDALRDALRERARELVEIAGITTEDG